jgi:hypothetical protein
LISIDSATENELIHKRVHAPVNAAVLKQNIGGFMQWQCLPTLRLSQSLRTV